jgi:hypothetical protein
MYSPGLHVAISMSSKHIYFGVPLNQFSNESMSLIFYMYILYMYFLVKNFILFYRKTMYLIHGGAFHVPMRVYSKNI